jgi:hypothetical protein
LELWSGCIAVWRVESHPSRFWCYRMVVGELLKATMRSAQGWIKACSASERSMVVQHVTQRSIEMPWYFSLWIRKNVLLFIGFVLSLDCSVYSVHISLDGSSNLMVKSFQCPDSHHRLSACRFERLLGFRLALSPTRGSLNYLTRHLNQRLLFNVDIAKPLLKSSILIFTLRSETPYSRLQARLLPWISN